MKIYTLGRNIVLWTSLVSFVTTGLFFTHLAMYEIFFVTGNILQHIFAVLFFVGLVVALYGLLIKHEYQAYKFSIWDLVFVVVVVVTASSHWYTIVTPHPLLSDQYYI